MADSNVVDRMRQDWNARAREDAHYYVAFGRRAEGSEQVDAEFFATAVDVVRGLRGEIKRLPAASRRRALEIGCGPGRLMRPLSADFGEIHGIDVSDEMIRLAAEKLRPLPNAFPRHAAQSNLAAFADESFDFVYSYAVFQHIPSREVVLGYLAEARRVLRTGGILRCQINGLPESSARYTTWEGVRISAAEVADFALRHDFQLLALEGASTQYMWTTWRKQPAGWRASLRPGDAPATRLRAISNALTGDPLVPAAGPRAFAALRLENLPPDADLLNLEVRIEDRPGELSYLGPPEWDGVVQLNVALPPETRTGLVPVEVRWLGQHLAGPHWMRVIPRGPLVPRLLSIRDGVNLLSGARIVSRWIKLVIEEIERPQDLRISVDEAPLGNLDIFCTGPLEQRYEINAYLPDAVPAGPHQLRVRIGSRALPATPFEVA